ncbi:unnamed protein product [Diabrotica balteata]|uniref:Cytochrome P450 n=1 Tax=Diabrotica balteata TaxID=107213 RepID=A0A9N9SLK0_DIABA|nr:unnamed protein product [Diabrotica balteata]
MAIITGVILYELLGVVIGLATLAILYSKWAFQFWKNKGVPYFEPKFLWGNLSPPHKRTVPLGDELAELYQRGKDKGWKHVGLYNMVSPIYLPIDLNILKHVLTKDFNHFVDRGFYVNEKDEPIGAHLFAIGGKKWKNLRAKLTPTFTSGKMRAMFQTIADCGAQLNKYLVDELAHNEPIEIKDVLGNFSTDIIGSCAFGLECNSFKDPNNPFRTYGRQIFRRSPLQNLKFMIANNFPDFGRLIGITILDKEAVDFFSQVVRDTVSSREKNQVHRNDFMQLLINIKNNKEDVEYKDDGTSLTIDQIIAQCFVFFTAGFETSSTTIAFALYELSKNQNIQQKLRDEINQVLKKHNGQITYDSVTEMKYMNQIIDETLRIHSPAPFVTRVCVEDYVVPGYDVTIKKGVRVFIPIKGIHHDEEYYPNPKVFDPERFSDENKHDRNQYAHIPFGEGPRLCIGMRFGLMETKVALTNILKDFKVSLNKKTIQPLKLQPLSVIPQVVGGIWLDMKKI